MLTGMYLNISLLVTSSLCGLFGIYECYSKLVSCKNMLKTEKKISL